MEERWPSQVNGVAVPYGRPLPELRALLGSASERWVAIMAVGRSTDSEALGVLAELARSQDPYVRRLAVEVIGLRADGGLLEEAVLERLRDENEFVVRTAAETAAALLLGSARQELRKMLRERSPSTREVAVRCLAALWQEDDFGAVLEVFKADRSPEVRKSAGWTLRTTATAHHAAVLIRLWAADPLPRHRVWACELMTQYPEPRLRETVSGLRQDVDGHVRRAAVLASESDDGAV